MLQVKVYICCKTLNRIRIKKAYSKIRNRDFPILRLEEAIHTWRPSVISMITGSKAVYTAQKIKFSIKDFFSKCDQIRRKLRIGSHLLNKSLMENFIFCVVLNKLESK